MKFCRPLAGHSSDTNMKFALFQNETNKKGAKLFVTYVTVAYSSLYIYLSLNMSHIEIGVTTMCHLVNKLLNHSTIGYLSLNARN